MNRKRERVCFVNQRKTRKKWRKKIPRSSTEEKKMNNKRMRM